MDIVTDIQQLRKVCEPVPMPSKEESPDKLVELYDLLRSEMEAYNGQGMAANQLGIQQQIFVMKWEGMAPICLVNPVITKETKARKAKEGCLSLPGVFVEVTRPLIIKVKGFNQYFKPVTYKFRGIDARRACHEIDHLNGKLIIDGNYPLKTGRQLIINGGRIGVWVRKLPLLLVLLASGLISYSIFSQRYSQ